MIDTDKIPPFEIDPSVPAEDMHTVILRQERERGIVIADLMRRAEPAFREDADSVAAHAREQLLDVFRERARQYVLSANRSTWPPGEIEAVEWICRLAEAGHVGAARLLARIAGHEYRGTESVRRMLDGLHAPGQAKPSSSG